MARQEHLCIECMLSPCAHLHSVSGYSDDALDEDIVLEPLLFNHPSGRMEDDNVALLRRPARQLVARTTVLAQNAASHCCSQNAVTDDANTGEVRLAIQ